MYTSMWSAYECPTSPALEMISNNSAAVYNRNRSTQTGVIHASDIITCPMLLCRRLSRDCLSTVPEIYQYIPWHKSRMHKPLTLYYAELWIQHITVMNVSFCADLTFRIPNYGCKVRSQFAPCTPYSTCTLTACVFSERRRQLDHLIHTVHLVVTVQ